jgi:microcystin-dependent protein
MPFHTHVLRAHDIDLGELNAPSASRSLAQSANAMAYGPAGSLVALAPQTLAPAGASLPHNNMQPYLTLNFCIALQGIFPQRP